MKNFIIYIFLFISVVLYSCKDDLTVGVNNANEVYTNSISVEVDIPETRTRAIDLTPGSSLYLKNIWVGVYDVKTGKRVAGTQSGGKDLGNFLVSSGKTFLDLVEIEPEGTPTLSSDDRLCVVGVANFDGIKTTSDNALIDELEAASTWNKFIQIAIDTQNSEFENQTPVLMGYMSRSTKDYKTAGFVKVNQFKNNDAINLYDNAEIVNSGTNIDSNIYIEPLFDGTNFKGIKNPQSNKRDNYILKLRRLRSKINIEINTDEKEDLSHITIANMQYKVFNKPNSAFLAERRTNDFSTSDVSNDYSPNSADMLDNGYSMDEDWISPTINTNFSFEHFENKHWAIDPNFGYDNATTFNALDDYKKYHARGRQNDEGKYFALGTNEALKWNQNASYFVLKMKIRDDKTGRSSEVEYTILEGFRNNVNGVIENDYSKRLLDYCCVRNTDYTYKITIRGVDDIYVQVFDSENHTNDQLGKIWQINYISKSDDGYNTHDNYIETKNGIEINQPLDLKTKDDNNFDNSRIAFRLVGSVYNPDEAKEYPVDVCFNFKRGDLDGFSDIWPSPSNKNTEYLVSTLVGETEISALQSLEDFCNSETTNTLAQYFNKLKNEILIKYNGDWLDIVEYIKEINKRDDQDNNYVNEDPNIEGFKINGLRYYEAYDENSDNKRDHVRGLYIFDLEKALNEGKRIKTDSDECSFFYEINGAAQLPVYLSKELYEMVPVTSTPLAPDIETTDLVEFDDNHKGIGMLLSEYPDIAFRALGFNENGIDQTNSTDYFDIWYNIKASEYFDFMENEEWPYRNLYGNSTEIEKGRLDPNTLSSSFLNGIQIILNKTQVYNIYDFIQDFESGKIKLSKTDKLGFRVNSHELKVRVPSNYNQIDFNKKYMRALYLLDRKNKFVIPALLEEDKDQATFQAYAVEQKPNLLGQLKLPTPTGSFTQKNTYVNVLDPEIDEIEIPELQYGGKTLDASFYNLNFISRSGTNSANFIVQEQPVNGRFNFKIPMRALAGVNSGTNIVSGNIYLQAVSHDGDVLFCEEFMDSNESGIVGTYTLQAPPTWSIYTNPDNDLYKAYNNSEKNGEDLVIKNDELKYLSFTGGNFRKDDARGLRFQNGSSVISFKIYKPCRIVVGVTSGQFDIRLDSETKATGSGSLSYTVTEADFGGKSFLEASLQRNGGTSYLQTIQVIPTK